MIESQLGERTSNLSSHFNAPILPILHFRNQNIPFLLTFLLSLSFITKVLIEIKFLFKKFESKLHYYYEKKGSN